MEYIYEESQGYRDHEVTNSQEVGGTTEQPPALGLTLPTSPILAESDHTLFSPSVVDTPSNNDMVRWIGNKDKGTYTFEMFVHSGDGSLIFALLPKTGDFLYPPSQSRG